MAKKNEAILIRNRGGKLLEFRLIPHGRQAETAMITDNVVTGSMEIKTLPANFDELVTWLDANGRIGEVEKMIKVIFGQYTLKL